jgi:ABC-type branched-subunit amino acid transport system ATPase component
MLLLDEPSAGLSEPLWKRSVEVLKELAKSGLPMLIVEHGGVALKDILSKSYLIERGRLSAV